MAVLACTVMLSFSPPLLSECGDCTLFGFILSAQLQLCCISLILASIAQTFRLLRSITLQEFVFLPYATRGRHGMCDGNWELCFAGL